MKRWLVGVLCLLFLYPFFPPVTGIQDLIVGAPAAMLHYEEILGTEITHRKVTREGTRSS